MFITGIMDSLEDFFDALIVPTAKYIRDAFIISLLFLAVSFGCSIFNIWTFVSWEESLACSIILLIVMLIDSTTRSSVRSAAKNMKKIAAKSMSRISYKGDEDEVEAEAFEEEVVKSDGE